MGLDSYKQSLQEQTTEQEQEPSPTADSTTDTDTVSSDTDTEGTGGGVPAPAGGTSIGEILQNDGGVDSLSDWQVKDVWVRMIIARNLFRAATERQSWRANNASREDQLANSDDGLRDVIGKKYKQESREYKACIRTTTNESLVNQLFQEMTKDYPEEKLVATARKKIKRTLRQSGMPAPTVARQRIQHHNK